MIHLLWRRKCLLDVLLDRGDVETRELRTQGAIVLDVDGASEEEVNNKKNQQGERTVLNMLFFHRLTRHPMPWNNAVESVWRKLIICYSGEVNGC